MKKVYLILGHPSKDSFNGKLADAYENQLKKLNYEVKRVNLIDLNFDLNLHKENQKYETTIKQEQENIKWADELIFFYPLWWGNVPALLKGYIDNVFTPNFAYKYHSNDSLWDKLLKGKTARIFSTCDAPSWFIKLIYKNCDFTFFKRAVCWFTGIKVKQTKRISKLFKLNETQRQNTITKIIKKIK
ncbi:NAD(P)H-dependent oxidoreductase [Mycoplasmopsis hyopharyngis]|uniref:NAD(P)H-dependent oxidoreductase n=1 Tax=Mycoplasmopsis hyopharyngis TaxID=29558 RepID=UPI00387388AA